jgi:hypothetical protein
MDYKKERISPSFFPPSRSSPSPLLPPSFPTTHPLFFTVAPSPVSFSRHCKNIYALNKEEIDYTWEEYKNTIHKMFDKELV